MSALYDVLTIGAGRGERRLTYKLGHQGRRFGSRVVVAMSRSLWTRCVKFDEPGPLS
jgi:hypothetical protein